MKAHQGSQGALLGAVGIEGPLGREPPDFGALPPPEGVPGELPPVVLPEVELPEPEDPELPPGGTVSAEPPPEPPGSPGPR